MGIGFGIVAAIKELTKEVREGFAQVNETLAKHTETLAKHTETLAKHTETLAKHTETLAKHTEMLQFLVAEVSRFKNDSDQLMLSLYAFHHIYDIPFTHGDLGTKGLFATRYARKYGFRVETTQDPRFGVVNLYEPEMLERCFLGYTDSDYTSN